MKGFFLLFFTLLLNICFGQDTLMLARPLPEVVLEEEKQETERLFSPLKIESISANEIFSSATSNTAEVLQKNGIVSIQKSQSGGGSPIVRGFEANRVLLVIDGVRLNNAIFRSGHIQNIITTSPFMLEKMDVIFGPASVRYGSDALGGVIHIHTRNPKKNSPSKKRFIQHFSSVNNGVGSHFDIEWSKSKWSFLHAVSVNQYGNLKMGKNRFHGYNLWGAEDHVSEDNEQLKTSYSQLDFLQKIRFDQSDYLSLLINTQFSTSSNIDRFDKLNDLVDGVPKYEVWQYGPQKRFLGSLSLTHRKKTFFFNDFNFNTSFQHINESRFSKQPGSSLLSRFERINVYSLVSNFHKNIQTKELNYGFDVQHNVVKSAASNNTTSRYADGGSQMTSMGLFSQFKIPFSKNNFIGGGVRYNQNLVTALFIDTLTYALPFDQIKLSNSAWTASLGVNINLKKGWAGSFTLASGFRSPNVDDVTKVFSKSNTVTVPNNLLLPEYSYSTELFINKSWGDVFSLEGVGFYTFLKQAIVKDYFVLNGQDSIVYEGELLPVIANQNIQNGIVYGWSLQAALNINDSWSASHSITYTFGKDLENNTPLDHIPPKYGRGDIRFQTPAHTAQVFVLYNTSKPFELYSLNGSDNAEEATVDGLPFWWTLNVNYEFKINHMLTGLVGLENILNSHYKTYASGISAPGRNLLLSFSASF